MLKLLLSTISIASIVIFSGCTKDDKGHHGAEKQVKLFSQAAEIFPRHLQHPVLKYI